MEKRPKGALLVKCNFTCLLPNGNKHTYSTPLYSRDNFKHVKLNKIYSVKVDSYTWKIVSVGDTLPIQVFEFRKQLNV